MVKRPRPIKGIRRFVSQHRPIIKEVVREPTSGGIVFRRNAQTRQIEILLIQDAKDRWTIPKGHIEENESAKETAEREIREETGLQKMKVLNWLGKDGLEQETAYDSGQVKLDWRIDWPARWAKLGVNVD